MLTCLSLSLNKTIQKVNNKTLGFPGGSAIKNACAKVGDLGLIVGWEHTLEEEMATHSSILPGEYHGQRSLVGYTVYGVAKSRTQQLLTLNVSHIYNLRASLVV